MSDDKKEISRRGRKKGIPNRNSWNMRLELEAAGFEPLNEMIEILRTTDDQDKRWDRLAWLCRHLYPQLKEIDPPAPEKDEEQDTVSHRSTDELLALVLPKEG